MECVENRYMFDTSALDALCKSSGTDELKIYASKGKGFEYYFTETQLEESEKNINSKEYAGLDVVSRAAAMRAIKMLKLVSKIQKAYVGRIATLTHNRWLLDGTFELLPSGEEKAFEELFAIFEPLVRKCSIVNGHVDEDLRQILLMEFVQAVRKFRI